MITHYDLFAGIGGFSLALDEVFNDETIKHIFCEWEHFPTAALKKHWPDGEFWGDIADLVTDTRRKHGGKRGGELLRSPQQVNYTSDDKCSNRTRNKTIVTGGFPCQPFSHAGRRKGTADDRYQWPNMLEVIRNVKPDWVIAENVRGLVTWSDGMVLEQVCTDLESEGYEVQPLVIPAVAVNAPHRRDRVWIIAHRNSQRVNTGLGEVQETHGEISKRDNNAKLSYPDWDREWQEVAFKTCHDGLDDGLSRNVGGLSYSAAKWRKEGLKAYGNAIVPQVAMEIFKAIRKAENECTTRLQTQI